MPDYDPTSIPILNDVIESDESEDSDLDESSEDKDITDDITPGLFEAEQVEADINIYLLEESVDSAATPPISEETSNDGSIKAESEPQIGILDDDSSDDIVITGTDAEDIVPEDSILISADNTAPETDEIESAQIDYSASEEAVTEAEGIGAEHQPVEQEQHTSLESMVDGITKELIPDLEQQLRYLIQQALEDRLPADVLNQLIDDKNKTS